MAIISGTAIAGAAITASTIASGAAFAASAAGTAISLSKASKQRKAQAEAEDEADKALAAAREKLEVNYLKGLSIQKEPYELAREAGLSGLSQIVQAGQEGEQRGAAATAGRANLFNQQQQAQARTAMGQELQGLQRAGAAEDARLQTQRVNLDTEARSETARGQQLGIEAANSQNQAMANIANMASVAGNELPPYLGKKTPDMKTLPGADTSIQGMLTAYNPRYGRQFGDPQQGLFQPIFPQMELPSSNFNIDALSSTPNFNIFLRN